jgi:hypothetical protein
VTPSYRVKAVLLRVRELTANATPGEWEMDPNCSTMIWTKGDPYNHGRMRIADIRGWGHLTGVGACHFEQDTAVEIQEANGALIAESRTLLPRLAEALERALEVIESKSREEVNWCYCPEEAKDALEEIADVLVSPGDSVEGK